MSKSIIYAVNTNNQVLTADSVISFGNIVRRYGCNLDLSGGNVEVKGAGYYNIDTNFTFDAAAGNATITLYKDGVEIPGAKATITTAASTNYAISIPAVIRQNCDCTDTITAVISGVGVSVKNASIIVDKL